MKTENTVILVSYEKNNYMRRYLWHQKLFLIPAGGGFLAGRCLKEQAMCLEAPNRHKKLSRRDVSSPPKTVALNRVSQCPKCGRREILEDDYRESHEARSKIQSLYSWGKVIPREKVAAIVAEGYTGEDHITFHECADTEWCNKRFRELVDAATREAARSRTHRRFYFNIRFRRPDAPDIPRPAVVEVDERPRFTYLMLNTRNGYHKIGRSVNPEYREQTLQAEEPEVELVWKTPKDIERKLHKKFAAKRMRGEWFDLSVEDVQYIRQAG